MHSPALHLLNHQIPEAGTPLIKRKCSCRNADKGYSSTLGDFASHSGYAVSEYRVSTIACPACEIKSGCS
jgi:hypothetical protein